MQPTYQEPGRQLGSVRGRPVLVLIATIVSFLPTVTWGFMTKLVAEVMVPTSQEESRVRLGEVGGGRSLQGL